MPTTRFSADHDSFDIEFQVTDPSKNQLLKTIHFIKDEIICNLFLITDGEISSLSNHYRRKIKFVRKDKKEIISAFCRKSPLDQKLFYIYRSLQIICHEQSLLEETFQVLLKIPEITSRIILETVQESFPEVNTNQVFLQQYKLNYGLFLGNKLMSPQLCDNHKLSSLLKKSRTESIYFHYMMTMFAQLRTRSMDL